MKIKIFKKEKGFTILELIVSVGIFALMTALLVAKYGNFNNGILLTNLAYDVALTIRNAQSYGLNVKSASRDSDDFNRPFGVHFERGDTKFVFFADELDDGVYNGLYDEGEEISISTIKNGGYISDLCTFSGKGNSDDCTSSSNNVVDITFKRPDPNAIIKVPGKSLPNSLAKITVKSKTGDTRDVIVRSNGQIAVED